MLQLSQVGKSYKNGLIATEALRSVSFEVDAGDFVSIMGPSGSGKTTLLSILGLLEEPDAGEYRLDGTSVRGLSDRALSQLRNRAIGFIFQSYNLVPDLDVFDNIELPLRYRGLGSAERSRRVERALEQVEMTARRHHLPSQLSGGQQQRAAIARAIAGEPRLLLCDEPTGNLDTLMSRQILDVLKQLHRAGSTIIMVTHAPELAAQANRRLHMIDGTLIDPRPSPRREAA
jgi:putative ABC transport system ATP-binding protein